VFTDGSANANYLAHAFSHVGIMGIILMSAILGGILKLIDIWTDKWDIRIASLILLAPVVSLSNLGLTTSLLTNGFAGVLLLVALTPSDMMQHESPDAPTPWAHDPTTRM
jgi:hypothetical protein